MLAEPDAVFDDCTLIGPDNAVQIGYPSFTNIYTRVQFRNCRMIVLNFSQPAGTPSSGIICCDIPGDHCDLDLEDCSLMGYKVFGISPGNGKRADPIRYTTKGRVRAYVQYQQEVPRGFPPARPLARRAVRRPGAAVVAFARSGTPAGQAAGLSGPRRDGIVSALVSRPAPALS